MQIRKNQSRQLQKIEETIMQLKIGKATNWVEKNATVLAFAAGAYERIPDFGDLVDHFTNLKTGAGGGALQEALHTVSNAETIELKFLRSSHLYTKEVMLGVGLYLAGEMGLLDKKYGDLGKKIAIGGGAAALVMPGSGIGKYKDRAGLLEELSGSTKQNFARAPLAQSYY